MSSKMWGGRFNLPTDQFVEEFSAVIHIETRLCPFDIKGSIAHATMLARQGIIAEADARAIVNGLEQVANEIAAGTFTFRTEDEDIHMAIEKRLIELIGPCGGRLHTGRSRNDQCNVDSMLYMRDVIGTIKGFILELQRCILDKAEAHPGAIMPGYTHLQTAQPVLFAHWIMAYFHMLHRDLDRFDDLHRRMRFCPLGAGALAGTTFPIDRHFTAEALGFAAPTENSIDSVSDRDYALELLSAAAICYMHLTRLAEEIVIFSSQDFKFFDLSDDYCTGSSIMPQKKNPDVAELIRGKGGRMFGNLMAMLTMLKGIPLAYNKDMMEDKELSYDSIDTLMAGLKIMAPMIAKMRVNEQRMRTAAARGYSTATDLADYLVRKGMPFRDAHHVVGQTVSFCVDKGRELDSLSLEEFKTFSTTIENDVYDAISLEASVAARTSYGGTAPAAVRVQLDNARQYLAAHTAD